MCCREVFQGICLFFTENAREGVVFQHILLLDLKRNDLSGHGAEVVVVWGDTVEVLSWK